MTSILSFAGYVPRHRLARKTIAEANRWFSGPMSALAKGQRSFANWDEDSVTMSVAAGRNALASAYAGLPDEVWLASTTAPFADRQNAGIVAAALGCSESVATLDLGGSLRAGTSAFLTAARGAGERRILVTAADQRLSRSGSTDEMLCGDGAAAFFLGPGKGVAEILGSAQRSTDFVDHYRASDHLFDYNWEERWVRDEGYAKIVPPAALDALRSAGVEAAAVDRFVLAAPSPAVGAAIAKKLGIREEALADSLNARVGFAGAAHPLLMLAGILEEATAGQTILVVGFGQGVDAFVLRTTEAISTFRPASPLAEQIERGLETESYMRYLAFADLVEQERGLRAELDLQTAPTILYRNRHMLLGFYGGECGQCGAVQFPKAAYCVNPNCGARDSQRDIRFADRPASLQSYTADNLTYTPDPPARYGMVRFAEGGCLMMDITDATAAEVSAGAPVTMTFRIKADDERRGIKKYFWKATPVAASREARP